MNTLQQLWTILFALCCFILLGLYHRRQRRSLVHEPQVLGACFDPFLTLFGKELISYLVRLAISAVFGMLGALCEQIDGSIIISVLTGILVGTMLERTLHQLEVK